MCYFCSWNVSPCIYQGIITFAYTGWQPWHVKPNVRLRRWSCTAAMRRPQLPVCQWELALLFPQFLFMVLNTNCIQAHLLTQSFVRRDATRIQVAGGLKALTVLLWPSRVLSVRDVRAPAEVVCSLEPLGKHSSLLVVSEGGSKWRGRRVVQAPTTLSVNTHW